MNRMTIKKHYFFAAIASIVLILLDQLTKKLAVIYLKGNDSFNIIENVFCLQYLENRGAAFGIMQGQQVFFLIMTTVVLILLIYAYGRIPIDKKFLPMRICAIFLFSGAIGNMIDRAVYNYVVDFFYFELINFPIFNVADIYVTVTTIIFVLLILFYYKDEELGQIKLINKK